MKVSNTELRTMYISAFEALGFETGVARDAAAMCAWCDAAGLDGIGRIADRIDTLRAAVYRAPTVSRDDGHIVVNAHGESLLRIGAMAFDIGHAAALGGESLTLTVADSTDVEFAPGLAIFALRRELDTLVMYRQGHDYRYVLTAGPLHKAELRTRPLTDPFPLAPAEGELIILFGSAVREHFCVACRDFVESTHCADLTFKVDRTLLEGIPCDDVAWARVSRVSKERLVPESAESRARGAAIGADDDN